MQFPAELWAHQVPSQALGPMCSQPMHAVLGPRSQFPPELWAPHPSSQPSSMCPSQALGPKIQIPIRALGPRSPSSQPMQSCSLRYPILAPCYPILALCYPIFALCYPILAVCYPILALCYPILALYVIPKALRFVFLLPHVAVSAHCAYIYTKY